MLEHNDEVKMAGHVLSRMMMLSQISSGFIKQGDDIDVIGDEKNTDVIRDSSGNRR